MTGCCTGLSDALSIRVSSARDSADTMPVMPSRLWHSGKSSSSLTNTDRGLVTMTITPSMVLPTDSFLPSASRRLKPFSSSVMRSIESGVSSSLSMSKRSKLVRFVARCYDVC